MFVEGCELSASRSTREPQAPPASATSILQCKLMASLWPKNWTCDENNFLPEDPSEIELSEETKKLFLSKSNF